MKKKKIEQKLMTQKQYAEHVGCDQSRISRLMKQGKLKGAIDKEGKIDPDKADIVLKKNLAPENRKILIDDVPKEEKVEAVKNTEFEKLDYNEARTLNEQYKAMLNKLEYEEKANILVNIEDINSKLFKVARQIRDSIQAIPDRCSALVAVENDAWKCKQLLSTEIDFILNDLSEKLRINAE